MGLLKSILFFIPMIYQDVNDASGDLISYLWER